MFDNDDVAKSQGYVKVPDEATSDRYKVYGMLSGKYIRQAVLDDVNFYLSVSRDFGMASEWISAVINPILYTTRVMKINDTVKNASTHLYNFLSNTFLVMLNDPKAFGTLITDISTVKTNHTRLKEIGLINGEMPDLDSMILKNNIDSPKSLQI